MRKIQSRKLTTFKKNLATFAGQRVCKKLTDVMDSLHPFKTGTYVPVGLAEYYHPTILAFYEEFKGDVTLTQGTLADMLQQELNNDYERLISQRMINNSWSRYRPVVDLSPGLSLIQCKLGEAVFATLGA